MNTSVKHLAPKARGTLQNKGQKDYKSQIREFDARLYTS